MGCNHDGREFGSRPCGQVQHTPVLDVLSGTLQGFITAIQS